MECKDNQITDAILSSNQKRLDNAIYVATQERTRYFAERIARTELARAYHDGVTARWDNDPDCVAYQWRMSQSHPVTDICDLYAGADLYGMGAGVFPKGKVPELPAHPHCMCYLRPLMSGSLKLKSETPVERVNKGGKEWLDKQSKTARQNILGVMGEMQYKKGGNWQSVARGYGNRYMKSRLNIPKFDSDSSNLRGTLKNRKELATFILKENGISVENYLEYDKCAKLYTKGELIKAAKEWDAKVGLHTNLESRWSGKIVFAENGEITGKAWNCDIVSELRLPQGPFIHELLHSRSLSYFSPVDYFSNMFIEEGSVEYFAKQILIKEGYPLVNSGYDPFVQVLKEATKFCGYDDYQYSKMLFSQKMTERLDWLTETVYSRGVELGKGIGAIAKMNNIIEEVFRINDG